MNDIANRYRNIVAAIDNLLLQLGDQASEANFYEKLITMREVYAHEWLWHAAGEK
jgi:hypothetical protein